jgi:signal transduction histidine kinase
MRWRSRVTSLRGIDPRLVDAAIALFFVVVGQLSVWNGWSDVQGDTTGPIWLVALLGLIADGALAWRRRRPLAAIAVMVTAFVFQVLFVEAAAPFFTGYVPVVIAAYSVAAYAPQRHALAGGAIAITGVVIVTLRVVELRDVGDIALDVLVVVVVWVLGRGMHRRATRADALSDEVRTLEREAREAVAQERTRIARELHDVIAHSVSVMGVQAGAAEQMLTIDPERAREPLQAIQSGAREAISELRLLLGVLRGGDDGPALAPQPGLDQLDALVEQMRAAGLPTQLTVEGAPARLSAGVELSAYRIVQEALTNALKHAHAAAAEVTIRHRAQGLDLEVVNSGSSNGGGRPAPTSGHGLIGMRERVALYGGTITTGHHDGGGYTVRAHLPSDGRAA